MEQWPRKVWRPDYVIGTLKQAFKPQHHVNELVLRVEFDDEVTYKNPPNGQKQPDVKWASIHRITFKACREVGCNEDHEKVKSKLVQLADLKKAGGSWTSNVKLSTNELRAYVLRKAGANPPCIDTMSVLEVGWCKGDGPGKRVVVVDQLELERKIGKQYKVCLCDLYHAYGPPK